jgi:SAM-dependent methyltransferase/uncharacterized protein YbaR (Trm112 family)
MAPAPALPHGLVCPRCTGTLEPEIDEASSAVSASANLRCCGCKQQYPAVGTIPCLVPDPSLWRLTWLSRLTEFLAQGQSSIQHWRRDARASRLAPKTRARMERVASASEAQCAAVDALFADLKRGVTQLLPTATQTGSSPLLACYENLFRDWAWGDREAGITRQLVQRLISDPVGRLAVYGAGAGRLALDAHQAFGPTQTWALDLNPLPLLVAERLRLGETVTLPEFPVAPHSLDDVVIERALRGPALVQAGFSFLFADAQKPPFAEGSLDTVLTSWFIDATDRSVRQTAAAINRVLRPGGVWLNLGPLRFKEALAVNFSIEEVWDIASDSSFELLRRERDEVPYFDSPVSGARRFETVFSFAARKVGTVAPSAELDSPRPWLADLSLPVPLTPELAQLGQKSIFVGSVITLIDGARSLTDIAGEMQRLWGFDQARIIQQLRAFFASLAD